MKIEKINSFANNLRYNIEIYLKVKARGLVFNILKEQTNKEHSLLKCSYGVYNNPNNVDAEVMLKKALESCKKYFNFEYKIDGLSFVAKQKN